jgi:hypothetical protein
MSAFDAETFNTLFLGRLDEPGGLEKAAKAGGAYVRLRLREKAVNRGVLPPETVTKEDCQRSTQHDLLTKIVDIEPNSTATALNFRGQSNLSYIQGRRYEIPFFKIGSERFEADEGELMASDFPITKVIEDQSVRDMDRIEDQQFFDAARQVAANTGQTLTAAGPITRAFLANCINVMEDSQELAVDTMVMHKSDWNDYNTLPATDIGDQLASEVVVNGYKYNQIAGHKLIVTIKSLANASGANQLLGPAGGQSNIWFFAAPNYLGNSYLLGDVRFYIEKRGSAISFESWYYRGLGIGNRNAIVQGTLT